MWLNVELDNSQSLADELKLPRLSGKWCRWSQELSGSYEDGNSSLMVLLMEEIRRAPPGMYKTIKTLQIVNNGTNYLSTGAGFLPSTVLVMLHMSHKSRCKSWRKLDLLERFLHKKIINLYEQPVFAFHVATYPNLQKDVMSIHRIAKLC